MKIERLYAIMIYLLNHGRTSAGELAKHFEVSVRTIQRDMDSLCLSGIPIAASAGAAGGYEISDQFQLDRHPATPDDYSYILTALRGLVSATGDQRARQLMEKISHVSKQDDSSIILDFSVLREGDPAVLQMLQSAVASKRAVEFVYTNNNSETRSHQVEPIALLYRWYAWYLLAYSKVRQDYRTYKLVRMNELRVTDEPFVKEHEPADTILKRTDGTDSRLYTEVLVRCTETAKSRVMEYLKACILENLPDGGALMKLTVVENEQLWIGTLLSLGDQAEVISPDRIRCRLVRAASEIISLYR